MLLWQKELWLIDHGAALYFHHGGSDWQEQSLKPFVQVKDHVLLPRASELAKADEECRSLLNATIISHIVSLLPGEWLKDSDTDPEVNRDMYAQFLRARISQSEVFIKQAQHAREALI